MNNFDIQAQLSSISKWQYLNLATFAGVVILLVDALL